jgi:hypothetical protein
LREAACTANLKSSCRACVRVGKVRSRFLPPVPQGKSKVT